MGGKANLPELTPREKQVYDLVILGKPDKDIASDLGISLRTAKFHVSNIYRKYGVSSRIQLILRERNMSLNTSH
ncbi:MAG TPA: LuxR C-terminal-related transcriptional regulator [Bryobacteraceae bacterium]|nr:LuxR C-terminal-related transcriptional regulator [Bryobacteraceae bacterium]